MWNCARIRVAGCGKFWLFDKHHYVYIHMWTHACVHICVRVRVYVHMYVCVFYLCMYLYSYLYIYIYVCVCFYTCVCIYICSYTCIYIYIQIYVCVYMFIYIYWSLGFAVWKNPFQGALRILIAPPFFLVKICQILEKICQDLALRLRRISMMATKK